MASLQDDNLNVSSSLASLSVRCSNEITALLTNLTDLHKKIGAFETVQNRLEAIGGEEKEERLVKNRQATVLHSENNGRSADTDANVKENRDRDRTEYEEGEDKSETL